MDRNDDYIVARLHSCTVGFKNNMNFEHQSIKFLFNLLHLLRVEIDKEGSRIIDHFDT